MPWPIEGRGVEGKLAALQTPALAVASSQVAPWRDCPLLPSASWV